MDARLTDEALLARYRDGDTEAFAVLVGRYRRELLAYLGRYLGDRTDAEDAFQNTFLQLHRRAHLFDVRRRFRPWLYTVANHQAIDLIRKTQRLKGHSVNSRHSHESDETFASLLLAPDDGENVAECREVIEKAIWGIGKARRTAIMMIYFRGLKYRDAAQHLGIPDGTLKTRVHSGLLEMRRILERQKSVIY